MTEQLHHGMKVVDCKAQLQMGNLAVTVDPEIHASHCSAGRCSRGAQQGAAGRADSHIQEELWPGRGSDGCPAAATDSAGEQ